MLLSWQKEQLFSLSIHFLWKISPQSRHLKIFLSNKLLLKSMETKRLSQIKHFLFSIFPALNNYFYKEIRLIRFSTLFLSFMYLSATMAPKSWFYWMLFYRRKPPSSKWLYLLLLSFEYLLHKLSNKELEVVFLLPK